MTDKDENHNIVQNTTFLNMFTTLMNQVDTECVDVNDLKDRVFEKVISKIGLDMKSVEDLQNAGKSSDILHSVDKLEDTKSHDFLVVHTYPNGNYGYVVYKGTYKDAKKHGLVCLGREHGMYDGIPDEESYLVRRYPIYTLATEKVRIEVVPHGSWVSFRE
jgi:hypothetical protein